MQVSVVMSVYNSEEYLQESIDSVLNQTFTNFEFIIIDDGSTDASVDIVKKMALKDARIILIQNEKNLGLATSLNRGIESAKGQYIARQDADDLSALERFRIQYEYAIAHPDIDIVASNSFIIDINGNVVCETQRFSKIKNFYENLLNRKAIFHHGSAFLKRSKLIEVGLYDPRFYYSQDGEYWLRLIGNGATVKIIEQPLYYYRQGPVFNNKKDIIKTKFNRVKNLKYVDRANENEIDSELEKIGNELKTGKWLPLNYYMANYWKGLDNVAYVNGGSKSIIYCYIFKALREKNSASNYAKYLMLGILYLLPYNLTSKAIKAIKD